MVVLAFIFPLLTLAAEFFSKDNRIYVTSQTCTELKRVTLDLNHWMESLSLSSRCAQGVQKRRRECVKDITTCVPEHVRKYQGKRPNFNGPNCWNLALVMKGILPNLRYSSKSEMSFFMGPPLCRQLEANEPRDPGDVGAIRFINSENQAEEYHGFIYISEHLVYSKNGYFTHNPFSLQSLDSMYDTYGVQNKAECRGNRSNVAQCGKGVSFYRCESLASYIQSNPNIPLQLQRILNGLSTFEGCLESAAFGNGLVAAENQGDLLEVLRAMTVYVEQEKEKDQKKSLEESFMLLTIQLRMLGILYQLGDFRKEKDPPSDLSVAIEKSLGEVQDYMGGK